MIRIADLFCEAGGETTGIVRVAETMASPLSPETIRRMNRRSAAPSERTGARNGGLPARCSAGVLRAERLRAVSRLPAIHAAGSRESFRG